MITGDNVREERIDGPDGVLSVRFYGSGIPVLALHGYSDSGFSFARLAEHMHGYCLIAPDFRGHGKSGTISEDLTIEKLVDDAEAVFQTLAIEQPFVIGHSMGAMTAIGLAARRRVRALAVIAGALAVPVDTAANLRNHVMRLLQSNREAESVFSDWHRCERPIPADFAALLAKEARRLAPETWQAGLDAILEANVTANAKRVLDRAMIIYGSEDQLFYPAIQNGLANALRADQRVEMPGVGHNPHWEAPETVARHLHSFFRA